MRLSLEDRERIEALPFDPAAAIAFHEILGCLVWSDEVPDGLTTTGHDLVRDLLATRGAIHRGEPADLERWNELRATGLAWNGFQRLALTAEQQALLRRYLADDSDI